MTTQSHGLSIGIERIGNEVMLVLSVAGKLTHEDYEIFTPMLESALAEVKQPKIKALIDMTMFDGWELQAAWDDFKLGLQHGNEFTKVAILGNEDWEKWAAKIGGWFIAGKMEYFEDPGEAQKWLSE